MTRCRVPVSRPIGCPDCNGETEMITKTVRRQASQVFATLIESVKKCPESDFGLEGAGDSHESIGRIAMHIGGSIENAFTTASFKEKWNTPVHGQAECIAYLESCRDDLMVPFIEADDLASPDEQPEYFVSRLDRVMKLLRHVAHHTGEMGCLLRAMGIDEGRFIQ